MSEEQSEVSENVTDPDLDKLRVAVGQEKFDILTQQTRYFNHLFKNRRKLYNEKLLQPPTPTKGELDQLDQEVEENLKTKILIQDDFSSSDPYVGLSFVQKIKRRLFVDAIHPQSGGMTYWYLTLMLALLYNAYVIPLRVCFTPYQNEESFLKNKEIN